MDAKIVLDSQYGYLRLDPVPSKQDVDKYYAEEFYARANSNYVNNSSLENMQEEADFHRRAYSDLFDLIESSCSHMLRDKMLQSVIDVGCGYGYWLSYLKSKGITGLGIEPVAAGVEHCTQIGVEAICSSIEDLQSPPGSTRADILTMLNVLEHLREPAETLKCFHKNWLKEAGYLLIRVPNDFNTMQMAANQLFKLDQWWVAPPRHINYFNLQSLNSLLAQCGFEIVDAIGSFPLEMFMLMGEVYVGDAQIGKACHRKRVAFEENLEKANQTSFRRKLYREFAKQGIGRDITILAQAR